MLPSRCRCTTPLPLLPLLPLPPLPAAAAAAAAARCAAAIENLPLRDGTWYSWLAANVAPMLDTSAPGC